MANIIKVALIQIKMDVRPKNNLEKAIKKIQYAKLKGAQIICLPELFLTHYFCQEENHSNFSFAEKVPGPTIDVLSKIAVENKVILIVPLFEKKLSGVYYNSCVIINDNGKIIGHYRKMHIPDDPQYYEKFYFTPGDLGFKNIETKFGNIGTLICWDQWFPEAARITTLKGAEIIFYPTAIGWHLREKKKFGKSQLNAWLTIQRSHAIANGVYVVAVNRVGYEGKKNKKIQFWGNSVVVDPNGNIIAQGHNEKEEIIICKIDLNKVEKVRQHWPFLRDRRIDFYKELLKNSHNE